jgi:hypothetical protein
VEDEVDLDMLKSLNRYWMNNPPVHLLMKGFVGWKPQPGSTPHPAGTSRLPPSSATVPESIDSLFAKVSAIGGNVYDGR